MVQLVAGDGVAAARVLIRVVRRSAGAVPPPRRARRRASPSTASASGSTRSDGNARRSKPPSGVYALSIEPGQRVWSCPATRTRQSATRSRVAQVAHHLGHAPLVGRVAIGRARRRETRTAGPASRPTGRAASGCRLPAYTRDAARVERRVLVASSPREREPLACGLQPPSCGAALAFFFRAFSSVPSPCPWRPASTSALDLWARSAR